MNSRSCLALCAVVLSIGWCSSAQSEPVVAVGSVALAGKTEAQARELAKQFALQDLRDRVQGIFFIWQPGKGVTLLDERRQAIDPARFAPKVTRARKTNIGTLEVELTADVPGELLSEQRTGKDATTMVSVKTDIGLDNAIIHARRTALEKAVLEAVDLHFRFQRDAKPGTVTGRVFPVGAPSDGLGKDLYLLSLKARVVIGTAAASGLEHARNIRIDVQMVGGGQTYRSGIGVGAKIDTKHLDGTLNIGQTKPSKDGVGLHDNFTIGNVRAHLQALAKAQATSSIRHAYLVVQDGTSGYLDVGQWTPIGVPFDTTGIPRSDGKRRGIKGTMPIMTHTGTCLEVWAKIVSGDRVKIRLRPVYSKLNGQGTGAHVASFGTTVTARNGHSVTVGGLNVGNRGASSPLARRMGMGTMTVVVTPHILP